ncbi:MAG: hypothetical protein ACRDTT_12405 [Pseudonocardiaceae bacterium]
MTLTQTIADDVQQRVIDAVLAERRRQDELFGAQLDRTPVEWIAIITEELGEAARPALTMAGIDPRGGRSTDLANAMGEFRKELLHVAALAVKTLEYVELVGPAPF